MLTKLGWISFIGIVILYCQNVRSESTEIDCSENAVHINRMFISCCKDRPTYTSDHCIDQLVQNNTFSQVCLVDCIYRELDIYNGTDINMDKVQKYIETFVKIEPMKVVLFEAFKWCSSLDIDTLISRFIMKDNDFEECNHIPLHLDQCVWYYTLTNCPTQYANNITTCITKKEWVQACRLY